MYPTNHRQFRRINFRAPVVIQWDDNTVHGEVDNICNRGIFVKTSEAPQLHKDEVALVNILLTEGPATITVTMPAKLVRSEQGGLAFHSSQVNMYHILHLEQMFIYRKGKQDELTEDFCEYISSIPLAYSFAHSK